MFSISYFSTQLTYKSANFTGFENGSGNMGNLTQNNPTFLFPMKGFSL